MDPRQELRKCYDTARKHLNRAASSAQEQHWAAAQAEALIAIGNCLFGCLAAQQEPETESVPLPEPPSTTGAPTVVDEADLGGVAMFRTLPHQNVGPLHPEMAELMGIQTEFAIGNLE